MYEPNGAMAPGASWNGLKLPLFKFKIGGRDVDKVFVIDGPLSFCHGANDLSAMAAFVGVIAALVGNLSAFVPPIMTRTMKAMSRK